MTDPNRAHSGKTALVTGAAKRLGRAISLALADQGADVVVHYRSSAQDAEDLVNEIRSRQCRAWALQADLSDPAAVEGFWSKAVEAAGPIDILINNASIFPTDYVTDMTVEALERSVRIHAVAPLLLARALAGQGRPGKIVNMLDARMVDYDRAHASYHLAKRMAYTITRMLAIELAPAVAVNAVAPGAILPPPGGDPDAFERLAHVVPLQRVGNVDEIVRAVQWLLGSDFVTGQVLFVDGGRHLKGRVYD